MKLFSSQSSQSSSQQKLVEDDDSNEPKVYYSTHISTKADVPKKENEDITESQFEECDGNTQPMQDSCYSWSGVCQSMDIKGEKRAWSDKKEQEPWWESFKSQSQSKSSEKSTKETSFSFSQPSSSQKSEASHSEQENEDNSQQGNESEKISFYLKLGKYKNFKYM